MTTKWYWRKAYFYGNSSFKYFYSFLAICFNLEAKTESFDIFLKNYSLRKNCPCSEFFWSVFSRIRTEYGDLRSKSPYSFRMRETTNQKNSKYRHFLRNDYKTLYPLEKARKLICNLKIMTSTKIINFQKLISIQLKSNIVHLSSRKVSGKLNKHVRKG